MNSAATKQDIKLLDEKIDTKIDQAVDDLTQVIDNFATRVDERFSKVEFRLNKLEQSFERLQNTLDAFLKRLDDMETENTARDAQLARLERWIEQVAKKADVKLEY